MAACGGDDGDDAADDGADDAADESPEATLPAESGDAQLEVSDFSFSDVTAPAGGTVEVVNSSGASHTVTADDGAFDEPLGADDTIQLTVPDEAGEYPFHCEIHSDMTATLTAE
ncbi:MAG TPA: cupredoxin domain-containing protein [Acidimicrobiales bacterium]|nr:cupredoxin domain-containing protein [Acidimicrobiales bacterium]